MISQSHPENPFKGLRPFEQDDQEKLFGRERDLILVKDRILSGRTTLLFAGSGVGKTSFLNAKVIPELKERYSVIWHNRWTGAEERSDADTWDDRPPFRIWPPKAFGKWLAEALFERAWLHRKISKSDVDASQKAIGNGHASPKKTDAAAAQQELVAAVQNVISESLRSGNKKRLSDVLSVFKKTSESNVRQKPCILILDQFEEIFQYHAYEDYFQNFISDLCKVVNDDNYQVRVVFSMREEFLGELSVFDNRIPDLFNNYYRLRYPEKDEAKHIITQTCKLAQVQLAPENLDKLVEDLSTIEKSFEVGSSAGAETPTTIRLVRRNFVPPPYLQIVCDTLWKEQYKNSGEPTYGTNNERTETGPVRFLENYKAGSEKSIDGGESGAQRAVREFCEAKLSSPFLKKWEQSLAARAFGFLVTKQGAKMAYELRSLASHMDERVWAVKHTLQKLSRSDARILRESRGPEGSYWFELYHDMYAGVVERWKRRYRRETRRRQRRQLVAYATLVAVLILVPLAAIYWIKRPLEYSRTISDFKNNLQTTEILSDKGYSSALAAYSQLKETVGYAGRAGLLWAEVWQKRAQLFEAKEKQEEALICLVQAAALAQGYPAEKEYLARANNLLAGGEESIKTTYCSDCKSARISPDGRFLFTITNDGMVDIWSTSQYIWSTSRYFSSRVCFDCDQALFSADSNSVVTVSPIVQALKNNAGRVTRQTVNGSSNSELEATAKASPSPSPGSVRSGDASTQGNDVVGWKLTIYPVFSSDSSDSSVSFEIPRPQNSAAAFRLKAVGKSQFGRVVAGILDNKLTIWREDGSEFVARVPLDLGTELVIRESPEQIRATFSPDGRFFATGGLRPTLWEITSSGLLPSRKITNLLQSSYRFSSDGRYYVAATSDGDVKLWELPTQKEVLTIDVPTKQLGAIEFAVGSRLFSVAERNDSITVWDSDTRQPTSSPLVLDWGSGTILLDSEGKHILLADPEVVSKWSLETGKQVGELQVNEYFTGVALTSEGSLFGVSNSFVRLWDIPAPKSQATFGGRPNLFADLSSDGDTMVTAFRDISSDLPSSYRFWNVPTRTQVVIFNISHHQDSSMTSDGFRLAVARGRTVEMFDRSRPDSPQTLSFEDRVQTTVFSPDNKLLAVATAANEVKLIDTSTYQTVKAIKSDLNIGSLIFAPNNRYLLIGAATPPSLEESTFLGGSDQAGAQFEGFESTSISTIEIWSISHAQRVALNLDQKESIQSVALSTNDRLFAVQNNRMRLWSLSDGAKLTDEFYGQDVVLAQFSPSGNFVVIGDRKGVLQLYDVASGTRSSSITIGAPARKIIFAEDGTSFVGVTASWMHHITIVDKKLVYSDGIFAASVIPESVRQLKKTGEGQPDAAVGYLRWIRNGKHGLETREASFDGRFSKTVLQGNSHGLLGDWKTRLGFSVDPEGLLSRTFPGRFP